MSASAAELHVAKLHVAGNDFVLVEVSPGAASEAWSRRASALCDRRTGVGGDHVVLCSQRAHADVAVRVLNPDGSETPLCGNALIVVAGYRALRYGRIGTSTIETAAGPRRVEVDRGGWTRVDLGVPRPEREALVTFEVQREATALTCVPIDTGVVHVVVELDEIEGLPIAELGASIEQRGCFAPPLRLVFVSRDDGELLHMRRWQPGATGEAPVCGTGAASAAYVAAIRTGRRRGRWRLRCSGGELYVTLGDGDRLVLEARAVHVFDALVDLRGALYAA